MRDAGVRDAGGRDAGLDAGGRDAGLDAGPADAGFDACSATPEVCDGVDDDCDGTVDEGTDVFCSNACGTMGSMRCDGGALGACDAPPEPTEVCNGADDDCDGAIDEDPMLCPCEVVQRPGGAYMFCEPPLPWTSADIACRDAGYGLVTIDDATEDRFVAVTAATFMSGDWWIGYNDRATEGTFEWTHGSSTYANWAPGEPMPFLAASRDCVVLRSGDTIAWYTITCDQHHPYVCESLAD